jgi:hypothetical protein
MGEDNVPVFTNPDTGRPFTGDDPRAQAQAWVNAYNNQLKDMFNEYAADRHTQLEQVYKPVMDAVAFDPIYDKLDPVRKQMFDALVEGHEVYDADGDHVGYDVDLNATLERVNNQVRAVQQAQNKPAPTSPTLDMPNVGGGTANDQAPKSLAEAMERAEQAKLDKQKKG